MARAKRPRSRFRPARMLQEGADAPLTVENWPAWLISDSPSSPFIDEGVSMFEGAAECQGVRPSEAWNGMKPPPVILHRNWSKVELTMGSRGSVPMRVVVWSARMGLGNSMRGLIHTFIFALLSSRQMLISTGGVYGKSIKTLYAGFQGNLDWTDESVPRIPMYDFDKPVLPDGRPVLQGNPSSFCYKFWWPDRERRACVYGALSCTSIWCVYSRIVLIALGSPRPELGEAIESMLVVVPPPSLPQQNKRRLSSDESGVAPLRGAETTPFKLWSQSGLGITTPSSAIRPQSHREGGRNRRLQDALGPKGLKLKFDVALHVRTYHKCLEGYKDMPECHEQGLEHSKKVLNIFPELREFVSIHRWSCVSNLLGFLLALKAKGIKEKGAEYQGLFRSTSDGEELHKYLAAAARRPGRRPGSTAGETDGLKDQGEEVWSEADAKLVAENARAKEGPGTSDGSGGLSVFLATDNEALRPLFVEYLKPFGTVAYSHQKVVHLAHKGFAKQSRLWSLGEFYLMSRSSALVAYNALNSTYAHMASLYGNTTLLRGVGKLQCDFTVEHIAGPALH